MSKSILLSRSARFCAGRVSLSHLRDKRLRFGELDAAFRLRRFPADSRVWWVLYGNKLLLEVL